jgi:hypothetical protein
MWLSYLIAMLAISTLHVAATIWQTSRSGVRLWKANPFVVLLLRLELPDGNPASLDDEGRVPREILDQKVVLLCEKERGWSLSVERDWNVSTTYGCFLASHFTYDHRTMNTELPVRSAVLKHCTGGLVVRWVTTSESPLLYVFVFLLAP